MVSNLTDKEGRQSKGVLLLRTLAMPSDTNANGDIFVAGLCHKWIWAEQF